MTKGGRSWFAGAPLPDDQIEEFDEDFSFPLRNLSYNSPQSSSNQSFCYDISDIDRISQELGIPWEASKDIPFCDRPTFIGLTWDLKERTVSLAEPKREKYVSAIRDWITCCTHTLKKVQKLHGKLIHAAQIIPEGRLYLSNLEAMLSIFNDRPFLPRTPPRGTQDDLKWWLECLTSTSSRHPRRPQVVARTPHLDLTTFSHTIPSTHSWAQHLFGCKLLHRYWHSSQWLMARMDTPPKLARRRPQHRVGRKCWLRAPHSCHPPLWCHQHSFQGFRRQSRSR
jgi:hypothetical protein